MRGSIEGLWRLVCALTLASVAVVPSPSVARADGSPGPVRIPSCAAPASGVDWALPAALPLARDAAPPPPITARTAVVIDGETGRVLYDLRAHDRMRPASTTKIMTAILAIERGDLDRQVISDVDASAMVGSSVMGLVPGAPITVRDLLYGLMLPSGNDAAVQLAMSTSGSVEAFVAVMNEKAATLGLRETHFGNPHGLDQRAHYSSAFDLSQLARYAMNNPVFAEIAGTRSHRLAPPWDYDLYNGQFDADRISRRRRRKDRLDRSRRLDTGRLRCPRWPPAICHRHGQHRPRCRRLGAARLGIRILPLANARSRNRPHPAAGTTPGDRRAAHAGTRSLSVALS